MKRQPRSSTAGRRCPTQALAAAFQCPARGIRFLVDMRAEMLPYLKADRRLQALDVEMEYMFSPGSMSAFWSCVASAGIRRRRWSRN